MGIRKNPVSRQLGLYEKKAEIGRQGMGESRYKSFERRKKRITEERVLRRTEETPLLNN